MNNDWKTTCAYTKHGNSQSGRINYIEVFYSDQIVLYFCHINHILDGASGVDIDTRTQGN